MTAALDKERSGLLPAASGNALAAIEYSQQSEKLSHHTTKDDEHTDAVAVEARFVTPQDPVIVTADGNRLPGVPLEEAHKLNVLKDGLSEDVPTENASQHATKRAIESMDSETPSSDMLTVASHTDGKAVQKLGDGSLQRTMPPTHTNPLFPPLPLYGPPSLIRNIQCMIFRVSSFSLSTVFLGGVVLGALFTSVPLICSNIWLRATFRNPDAQRPFYKEEVRRGELRKEQQKLWKRRKSQPEVTADNEHLQPDDGFVPTAGGPDPIVCDVGYYARRVGLDIEELHVQTEDALSSTCGTFTIPRSIRN